MKQMSCAGRFVRPFIRLLASYPSFAEKLERLRAMRIDDRIPIERAHETLVKWAERVGDPLLGLKAGELMCIGAGGPLDYALHSANSLRESISVAERYARLYSDALAPTLEVEGQQAVLRLEYKLDVPRVAREFMLSAWYTSHVRVQLAEATDVECWISGDPPENAAEYERLFAPLRVRFGARCDGFAFGADQLDKVQVGADALLHAVHCEHLESLHSGLPDQNNLSVRVYQLVAGELRRGRPTAVSVARQLHMSQRTLVRRLEAEGTSFSAQLDELRRQMALRFVCSPSLPLSEITTLLGFSHVQGFHRAFKRWTGQTPIQYRESQQAQATASQAGRH
ncbi:MAG TPA: AraC family transcriptional regulator ligand-binding domain-containing protein [Polyangiales bacterium]|nr:AraC family transcriptional regulator ligand-binding domain-containing protein [Polyangiales bacterium]